MQFSCVCFILRSSWGLLKSSLSVLYFFGLWNVNSCNFSLNPHHELTEIYRDILGIIFMIRFLLKFYNKFKPACRTGGLAGRLARYTSRRTGGLVYRARARYSKLPVLQANSNWHVMNSKPLSFLEKCPYPTSKLSQAELLTALLSPMRILIPAMI